MYRGIIFVLLVYDAASMVSVTLLSELQWEHVIHTRSGEHLLPICTGVG